MLYRYDGTFDGLMTAIYDAFYARLPMDCVHFTSAADSHSHGPFDAAAEAVPLPLWETFPSASASALPLDTASSASSATRPDMEERSITTDPKKADKVIHALLSKVGYPAYETCYLAHLSCSSHPADLIFQYCKLCFATGPKVLQMWAHPVAGAVMKAARQVTREQHRMLGFLRFQELDNGILFAEISPTNHVLELLAPHFADRLPEERWLIYDSSRNIACIHSPRKEVLFTDRLPPDFFTQKAQSDTEWVYQTLWKTFFNAIAIEGRYHPKCQRNLMPKKYWNLMTEFQSTDAPH